MHSLETCGLRLPGGMRTRNSLFITRTRPRHVATSGSDLIVLEADELHQVDVRAHQLGRKLQLNRPRKGSRVVEGEFVDERPVVDARPPFDGVQLLRVWGAATTEPALLVIADCVDDERAAIPLPDGVAPPTRKEIVRMLAAIHVDHPMGAGVAGL